MFRWHYTAVDRETELQLKVSAIADSQIEAEQQLVELYILGDLVEVEALPAAASPAPPANQSTSIEETKSKIKRFSVSVGAILLIIAFFIAGAVGLLVHINAGSVMHELYGLGWWIIAAVGLAGALICNEVRSFRAIGHHAACFTLPRPANRANPAAAALPGSSRNKSVNWTIGQAGSSRRRSADVVS